MFRSRAPEMCLRAVLVVAAVLLACAGAPTAKDREKSEIHYNLGVEALRANRVQDALKEFDAALEIDREFADASFGRGLVMEGFGKLDQAEVDYRRAIELRPAFPEAHNNLGQLLAKTNRLEGALREFDAALANMLYKEPYTARCNKGEALFRLGRKDEGLAEINACLRQNPRFCKGYSMLGAIHLEEGRPRPALAAFDKYAQQCPGSADAWYRLGLAQLRSGDATKAAEAFEKCEQLAREGDLATECKRSREMLQ